MAKLISIANQKGGVGKTHVTFNLAVGLTRQEKRVLVVDMDPQFNITDWSFCGDIPENLHRTQASESHAESLFDLQKVSPVPSEHGFDILLGSKHLNAVQKLDMDALYDFKDAIFNCRDNYDFILFDIPPTLGNLQIAPLLSSDFVVVPTTLELDSFSKMQDIISTIDSTKSRYNPNLNLLGILINGGGKVLDINAQYFYDQTIEYAGDNLFTARWHNNAKGRQARTLSLSVLDHAKGDLIARQIKDTVSELLERVSSHG